jgi:hypothetical protein
MAALVSLTSEWVPQTNIYFFRHDGQDTISKLEIQTINRHPACSFTDLVRNELFQIKSSLTNLIARELNIIPSRE